MDRAFSEIMDELVRDCERALEKALPDPQDMPWGESPAATVADAARTGRVALDLGAGGCRRAGLRRNS